MSRFLILTSLTWLIALLTLRALPAQPAAFIGTAILIAGNVALSLHSLTIKRTLPLALNCIQIVLFGTLSYQLASAFGPEHYRFDREPRFYDWIEFTAAHVLRAADLLDMLDEYGIPIQTISHNSIPAGLILLGMHLAVDIFLIGLLMRWAKRLWGDPPKETRLAQGRRECGWLLASVALFVGFTVCQRLSPRDWLLWPLDNLLRLLDVGDMFQLFGWRLDSVEPNPWTSAAAVGFRLAAGIWMARLVIFLRMTIFRTWGLSIDELIQLLDDDEAPVRRSAATGLGRSGSCAASAVPALIEALHDIELAVRCEAAWALGRIGPAARDACARLVDAVWLGRIELRQAAATALYQIGPGAAWVHSLAYLWIVGDQATRDVVAQTLTKIAPDVLERLKSAPPVDPAPTIVPEPKRKPWQASVEAADAQRRQEEPIRALLVVLVREGYFTEEHDAVALRDALADKGRRVQMQQLFLPLLLMMTSGVLTRRKGEAGRWMYRENSPLAA